MAVLKLIIEAKDIQIITGRSPGQSRRILRQLKKYFKKEKHQLITLGEYCAYYNISCEEVKDALKNF